MLVSDAGGWSEVGVELKVLNQGRHQWDVALLRYYKCYHANYQNSNSRGSSTPWQGQKEQQPFAHSVSVCHQQAHASLILL